MNITDYRISDYINHFYQPLNEKTAQLRSYAEKTKVPIISKDTELFILNLLRLYNPQHILEIGAGIGYSSICLATACPDAKIVTLELIEKRFVQARENIKNFGLEQRIELIWSDARTEISSLQARNVEFDLVFFDSAKSWYQTFWQQSLPMFAERTVILSDNVLLAGATASDEFITDRRQKTSIRHMRDYLGYIANLPYLETSILPIGDGLAFSIFDRAAYRQTNETDNCLKNHSGG